MDHRGNQSTVSATAESHLNSDAPSVETAAHGHPRRGHLALVPTQAAPPATTVWDCLVAADRIPAPRAGLRSARSRE